MSFSLEVKKFINSEHSGNYAEITLPGELSIRVPVKHAPEAEIKEGAEPEGNDRPTPGAKNGYETVTEHERCKIHYMEEGTGEPLLLIHTIGQSLYTWRGMFNSLSAHYRVLAIDLPGFGYSDRPDTFGFTVEDYADVIGLFLDAMGIESTHIAAFSMGAAYATSFALTHPERVGRLVMISPGGITGEMPVAVRMIDSPIFGIAASMLYNYKTVEKLLNDAVFDLTNITGEVVQEYYRPIADGLSRRSVRKALQYFDDETVMAGLRSLAVPVLMLVGSEDKWHPVQGASTALFHSAISNCGYAVIRNAGHLMHEEKPERVVDAILEFIPAVMPEI